MEPPSGRFFFFAPERPATSDQTRARISSPTLRALRGSRRRPAFRSARPPSLCRFCGIYTPSSRPQLLSGNHIFYRRFAYCASCGKPQGTHRFQRAVVGKGLLVRIRRPPKSPCLRRVIITCDPAHSAPNALRAYNGSSTHACTLEAMRTREPAGHADDMTQP
jgi:hypothetical protein